MNVLPSTDRRYLEHRGSTSREVRDDRQAGVILNGVSLPVGKFQVPEADILILFQAGYPDVSPDMFYVMPWLRLAPSGRYPKAADQRQRFDGRDWQRWSRHNTNWRAGKDGIWTMIKRIEHALEEAI